MRRLVSSGRHSLNAGVVQRQVTEEDTVERAVVVLPGVRQQAVEVASALLNDLGQADDLGTGARDDDVAAGLEGLQVVRDLGAEELRRVLRGLVDHHGHALGLHTLHDALDGARAEVVGVGLHRQTMCGYSHLISYSSKEGLSA